MKKAKYYIMTLAGALVLALGLCLLKLVPEPEGIMVSLPYLCIGIGCGLFGHGLGEIWRKRSLKSDPDLAKHLEIEAKDERNIMHANTAKAKGFDMMTYVLAALLIAYSMMGTSFHVLLPLLIAYLFIEFYAIYHRLRLDKEQ